MYFFGSIKQKKSYLKYFILPGLILLSLFVTFPPPCPSEENKFAITGIVEPIQELTLSLSAEGKIAKIFLKEGDVIKKNDIILTLFKKLEELEVKKRELIWESKAELNAAAERVETIGLILKSTEELYESMASVSKEELDEKRLEHKLAISEHKRLKNAELLEKIELLMAKEILNKKILRTPIKGTIVKLFLKEGENCKENEPLVKIVDTTTCRFICYLEEQIGWKLKSGQSVKLKLQTGSEPIVKDATIVFVSPVVDPASSLMEVKIEFNNEDGAVRPGVEGSLIF